MHSCYNLYLFNSIVRKESIIIKTREQVILEIKKLVALVKKSEVSLGLAEIIKEALEEITGRIEDEIYYGPDDASDEEKEGFEGGREELELRRTLETEPRD